MGQRPNASPGTTHCVSLQRTVLFDQLWRQYACAHWTSQRVGGVSRSRKGGEMRARGEVAASSRMLVHPAHFAIRCAQGTSGDLTHPYVRRPVHSPSCSGASAILNRPACDGETHTQRLEAPQARRSTSQHIAVSVREGRPKPSLTVPSETAPVGRAHAAAKQSRAGCGAVNPRHWRTCPSRPHDLRSSCGIVGKTTQGGWLLTSGPQDRASALEEEVVIEVDRHSRRLGTRRGDAFNVCPRRT